MNTLDLSGTWHGFYNYPIAPEPVPFTAELSDAEGDVVGRTEEVANVGQARGQTITATLQGRRSGFSVTWLKIYDGDDQHYDAVRYTGSVSEDGLEIEGRWTGAGQLVRHIPDDTARAALRRQRKSKSAHLCDLVY